MGETGRYRHPADDRRDRPSVVIRNNSDRWSAWCFRRNKGDVVFKDHVIPVKPPKESASTTVPDDIIPLEEVPYHTQREVVRFVLSKGVTRDMLPELLYSDSRKRLIIKTDCQYLLGRDLTNNHPVKWIDYTRWGKKHIGLVRKGGKVVIVEDVLSYYKVRYALNDDWDVLCLLGTHLRPSAALELIRADKVVIMLDGDEAGYRGARRVRKDLAYVPEVVVVDLPDGYDPKDLTIEQIRSYTHGTTI